MIAVGQLCSTNSLARNGQKAAEYVLAAAARHAKVLFLPEAADYIAGSPEETVALAVGVDESPFVRAIRGALRQTSGLYVSVGVHEPAGESGESTRVKNTLLWLNPKGEIEQRYQKVHLFDVDVANGPILRESRSVEPGAELPVPFATPAGVLGPGICYDIRFPEHAEYLRRHGAELLVFPSAFTVKTGVAHWHALNRARAIDTQSFVVSAAQCGQHDAEGRRQSYGHSLVVSPWGEVLAEAGDVEELIFVELKLDSLGPIRENMPLLEQRANALVRYL